MILTFSKPLGRRTLPKNLSFLKKEKPDHLGVPADRRPNASREPVLITAYAVVDADHRHLAVNYRREFLERLRPTLPGAVGIEEVTIRFHAPRGKVKVIYNHLRTRWY
jgi:hypothetical protein